MGEEVGEMERRRAGVWRLQRDCSSYIGWLADALCGLNQKVHTQSRWAVQSMAAAEEQRDSAEPAVAVVAATGGAAAGASIPPVVVAAAEPAVVGARIAVADAGTRLEQPPVPLGPVAGTG